MTENPRYDHEESQRLRAAVFGIGWWSKFQIPAWLEIGDLELVAFYNRTVSKAQAAAEKYGVAKVYDDAEELMTREKLDLVDIIAETPAHAPLVLLAAKHKIPVICQKPMGPDYATCLTMVRACSEAGVPFLINENYRWQPPFRALKSVLNERPIGVPFRASIQLSTGGPGQLSNQPYLKTLRHYALMDMGSHIFDVARFLFGEARSVYCQTVQTIDSIAGDDVAVATLRFDDLICTCTITDRLSTKIFIEGTEGSVELKPDHTIHVTDDSGTEVRNSKTWSHHDWITEEDERILGGDCVQSIVDCQRNLIQSLRTGRAAETSASESMKTMRLVFAAIESTLNNRAVLINGAGKVQPEEPTAK